MIWSKSAITVLVVSITVVMLTLLPTTGAWLGASVVAIVLGVAFYRWWARYDEEKEEEEEEAAEFMPPVEQHYRSGLELGDRGEWREAISEFDRTIDLDPEDSDALAHRGYAYAELDDTDRAIADMEKALALTHDPNAVADLEADIQKLRDAR